MNRLEILAFLCSLKNDTEKLGTDSRKPVEKCDFFAKGARYSALSHMLFLTNLSGLIIALFS